MPFLNDRVLDNGLSVLTGEANALHYCSAEPATYADVATYSLGNKSAPTVSGPAARSPSGRKITVSAVTDGLATASGQITHWALVDTVNSRLLAADTMTMLMEIVAADTITSDAFDVGIPGPA